MGGGDERLGRGTPPHLGGAPGEDPHQDQLGERAAPNPGSIQMAPPHPPGKAHLRSQVAREGLDTGSWRSSSRFPKAPAGCPPPQHSAHLPGLGPWTAFHPRKAQTQMGRGLLPKAPKPVSPSRPQLGRAGGFSFPLAAL